ncbi:MAG: YheU family protein [Methylococcus sp.]
MTALIVPHSLLPADTLRAMLEEYVTREGYDPVDQENPVGKHVDQVVQWLDSGRTVIVYDTDAESFSLMDRDQARVLCPDADV